MGLALRMFPSPPGVLKAMASIVGKSAEMGRLVGSLVVDCAKIRSEIGWIPPYTMSQGLRETVEWYLAGSPITGAVSKASRNFVSRAS